jgi:hypothetical protein
MGKWVIALVAVAAALAAPSSLAQVVLAQSIFHAANLPSNTVRTFTVACPAGYVAVSAGVSSPARGAMLLSIRPSGVEAYTFRVGNPAANDDQQVTVVVACRRFFFKLPNRVQVTPLQLKVNVPAGRRSAAGLLCPPNTAPAGWGDDLAPVQSHGYVPGAAARVSVRKASMHPRGFSFSVRNSGSKARTVTLYGTCLTVVRPAGGSRERLHVKITTFRVPLQRGSQRVVHSCPTGWVSLAAGYALRSPVTTIDGAAAIGQGGRWWIASDARSEAGADLQLVCARLGK